jgi:hypothetical protein
VSSSSTAPASLGQEGGTHWLVIDEGPRRAAGAHDAFQRQRLVRARLEAMLGQHAPDRMAGHSGKLRRDACLFGPHAYDGPVCRRSQRQRQSIKNDGFAGSGLAGQRGEAVARLDIETVDQHEITNGQSKDHDCTPNSTERVPNMRTKTEQMKSARTDLPAVFVLGLCPATLSV